jgi:hypothetical protein
LLFYQAYAIVFLKVNKNKKNIMSERFTEKPVPATYSTPEIPGNIDRVKTKFDDIADKLMAYTENLEPIEQLETMRGFVSQLLEDAESGSIKNSAGESYSRDDIEQQLIKFVEGMDNPSNEHGESTNPLMFIPRADGLRSAFLKLANDEAAYRSLREAVIELKRSHTGVKRQEVAEHESTESLRESVSKNLSEVAIAEAFEHDSSPEIGLFNGLSQEAQSEIKTLRSIEERHGKSHRDKEFAQAAQDKRDAFSYMQSLSDEAKQFLHESDQP